MCRRWTCWGVEVDLPVMGWRRKRLVECRRLCKRICWRECKLEAAVVFVACTEVSLVSSPRVEVSALVAEG